ncbi:cytochrome c-type biogenesis protein CcsB [compost metagenome]
MDVLDLVHHVGVDMQTAGGIDDDHVDEFQLGLANRRFGDGNRLLAVIGREEGDADVVGEGFQLLDGRRAIDVRGHHQHRLLLALLEEARQLADGGGLARALQAGHQDHRRRRDAQRQVLVGRAHQLDQLGLDDLHEGLARSQALGYFGADRALLDPGDEVLDHRQGNVGFEQRHPHFAEGVLDVVLGQLGLAGYMAQRLREAVCKVFEHAQSYRARPSRGWAWQQARDYSGVLRRPTPPMIHPRANGKTRTVPRRFLGGLECATLTAFRTSFQGLMHSLLPSLIAAALYLGATAYQGASLARRTPPHKPLLLLLGLLALLGQGFSLYQQLLTPAGLVLDFFNAASLISVAVTAITLLACLRIPVENLLLLLYPLGALTTLTAVLIPHGTIEPINEQPGLLAHILLSILAYGLLTIAVLQALLLLVQDYQLKHKHPSGLIRNFPPLQTMESLLFDFLRGGWVLLTLSLISGWLFVDNLFAQHLAHKTILSCFAWVVFSVLLWGRHQLGWRGHKAVRWTLAGFLLLMLAYFGSKLVREFILHI